jgi:hypothetical protein
VAQHFTSIQYSLPAPEHIVQFDINRDRRISSIDLSLIAQNFNGVACM